MTISNSDSTLWLLETEAPTTQELQNQNIRTFCTKQTYTVTTNSKDSSERNDE